MMTAASGHNDWALDRTRPPTYERQKNGRQNPHCCGCINRHVMVRIHVSKAHSGEHPEHERSRAYNQNTI